MNTQQIAHLHNHTDKGSNLRLIDCIIKVEDLIDYAVEQGDVGVAITDHESLSAHVDALCYVKDGKASGKIPKDFKLILGNEIYLVDEVTQYEDETGKIRYVCNPPFYHFILLAKDEIGHRQLRKLSSIAWKQMFRTGEMERVPLSKEQLKQIVEKNRGHLIASTACLGSELGKTLLDMRDGTTDLPFSDPEYDTQYKEKLEKQLTDYLKYCVDLFGEDFYLEMQPNDEEDQTYVNEKIIELADKYAINTIITTDSHYLRAEDREYHKAYLKSHEEEREVDDFYKTTYLMCAEEIHEYMDENIGKENVDIALNNTVKIANKVKEYDLYHSQIVPKLPIEDFEMSHSFEPIYNEYPYIKKFAYSDDIHDRYFLQLIEDGWWEKEYREDLTKEEKVEMMNRIEQELEAVWESSIKINDKISSYYVTALDIVNMMWADNGGNSLVGPSRGSIAAFYTAYLIGLQQINSLKYNIPYWRHLHSSRPEMPKQHWAMMMNPAQGCVN